MTTVTAIWWFPLLPLVLARVSGIILVAPVFSHAAVPIKLRSLVALIISLGAVARMVRPVSAPAGSSEMLAGLAAELLVGAGIGYSARLLFAGLEIGAFHIAQQMGLALGEVFNPLTVEAPGIIRSIFGVLAAAIFLLIGGHRDLISALLGSFESIPLGGAVPVRSILTTIVFLLGSSFALALKVAAPVLVAMLLATVAMGMLQKTLPQCNLLTTHLPVRSLLGMVILAGSIVLVRPVLRIAVNELLERLTGLA